MISVTKATKIELMIADIQRTPGIELVEICHDLVPEYLKQFKLGRTYLIVPNKIVNGFDSAILEKNLTRERGKIGLPKFPVHFQVTSLEIGSNCNQFVARTDYLD